MGMSKARTSSGVVMKKSTKSTLLMKLPPDNLNGLTRATSIRRGVLVGVHSLTNTGMFSRGGTGDLATRFDCGKYII